jgi:hypothetical protein
MQEAQSREDLKKSIYGRSEEKNTFSRFWNQVVEKKNAAQLCTVKH